MCRDQKVKIADRSLLAIAGKGSIAISPSITFRDVLHVPKLSCNHLSISKLIHDMNCQAHFFSSHFEFQELNSGKTIDNVEQKGSLYFFEDGSALTRQAQGTCFNSISISSKNKVMLWNLRLGHPSFYYLKYCFQFYLSIKIHLLFNVKFVS